MDNWEVVLRYSRLQIFTIPTAKLVLEGNIPRPAVLPWAFLTWRLLETIAKREHRRHSSAVTSTPPVWSFPPSLRPAWILPTKLHRQSGGNGGVFRHVRKISTLTYSWTFRLQSYTLLIPKTRVCVWMGGRQGSAKLNMLVGHYNASVCWHYTPSLQP